MLASCCSTLLAWHDDANSHGPLDAVNHEIWFLQHQFFSDRDPELFHLTLCARHTASEAFVT